MQSRRKPAYLLPGPASPLKLPGLLPSLLAAPSSYLEPSPPSPRQLSQPRMGIPPAASSSPVQCKSRPSFSALLPQSVGPWPAALWSSLQQLSTQLFSNYCTWPYSWSLPPEDRATPSLYPSQIPREVGWTQGDTLVIGCANYSGPKA